MSSIAPSLSLPLVNLPVRFSAYTLNLLQCFQLCFALCCLLNFLQLAVHLSLKGISILAIVNACMYFSCPLSCYHALKSHPLLDSPMPSCLLIPHPPPTAKKTLNVGKSGLSAGLDDYVYEGAAGPDEDYDFM